MFAYIIIIDRMIGVAAYYDMMVVVVVVELRNTYLCGRRGDDTPRTGCKCARAVRQLLLFLPEEAHVDRVHTYNMCTGTFYLSPDTRRRVFKKKHPYINAMSRGYIFFFNIKKPFSLCTEYVLVP